MSDPQAVMEMELLDALFAVLADNGRARFRDLRVDCNHEAVTISGNVSSYYLKQLALTAIQRVAGGRQIQDGLHVLAPLVIEPQHHEGEIMKKAATRRKEITVDEARRVLCHHIELWCGQNVSHVKVRVNVTEKKPSSVWYYGRIDNKWSKLPETTEGTGYARLIAEELERLSSTVHSKECDVRRKKLADRVEYEIHFHPDDIAGHEGAKLGSYLFGVLFYERHAAPNTVRQRARRGAGGQVAH